MFSRGQKKQQKPPKRDPNSKVHLGWQLNLNSLSSCLSWFNMNLKFIEKLKGSNCWSDGSDRKPTKFTSVSETTAILGGFGLGHFPIPKMAQSNLVLNVCSKFFAPFSISSNPFFLYIIRTSRKMNMDRKNHLMEKENRSSKPPFLGSRYLFSRV